MVLFACFFFVRNHCCACDFRWLFGRFDVKYIVVLFEGFFFISMIYLNENYFVILYVRNVCENGFKKVYSK